MITNPERMTKGDWDWLVSGGVVYAREGAYGDGCSVAMVFKKNMTREEHEANGRLIATAPKMRQLLIEAAEMLSAEPTNPLASRLLPRIRQLVRYIDENK